MDANRKMELLEELFEAEEGALKPGTELASLDNWDSMMKLSLIVMMDDECGKKLTSETIRGFATIGDIMDFMV